MSGGLNGNEEVGLVGSASGGLNVAIARRIAGAALSSLVGRIAIRVSGLSLQLEAKKLAGLFADPPGQTSGGISPLDFVIETVGVDANVEDCIGKGFAVSMAHICGGARRSLASESAGNTIGNSVALTARIAWSAEVGGGKDGDDAASGGFFVIDLRGACQTRKDGRGSSIGESDGESGYEGTA